MTDPPPHRRLITQLEADRARMLASFDASDVDEVRIATSSLAAGYLHAIAWTLQIFEGADARDRYLHEHADGRHLIWHDGPSIAEAAADDRRWFGAEKHGE